MHTLNPVRQFAIKSFTSITLFNKYTINITNSTLSMLFLCFIFSIIAILIKKNKNTIPSKLQSYLELFIGSINQIADINLDKGVKQYRTFLFTLFSFILISNLIGLLPYSFASTSHISVTFTIASLVFLITVFIVIKKHGIFFFKIFIPSGTPILLAPLLFLLEFISFLTKPISLSIRLAANMIAGHIMLDVIAFFVIIMGIFGILPFIVLVVMTGFEFFVAILQAYIFTSFAAVYINQADLDSH